MILLNFTEDESLKSMDTSIKQNVTDIKYWGDLGLSRGDLDILKNRIVLLLERGFVFKDLFKQYPYAMVTYVVFLARYKYKGDFWGMISEEIHTDKPNALDQTLIGKAILQVFDSCGLDYSAAMESNRKYVDSVLYEIGIPPESNFGDLFYIFKYGFMSNVEPQILIDEITTRAYGVHKPLLHFLEDSPEERAINFVLDIQDAYLAATQTDDFSNKYSGAYSEWAEQDKVKSTYKGKDSEEHVEVRPFYFFDSGKKGLCIVLPRQIMREEWVENAKWKVVGDNDFRDERDCYVQGVEGKRFIDQLVVSVKPCKAYTITFEYDDGFGIHTKDFELRGLEENNFFYFNSSGRKINQRYLKSPYGTVIYSSDYEVLSNGVARDIQAYHLVGSDYRIEQITPLAIDSQFIIKTKDEDIVLQMRPQVIALLSGQMIFDSPYVDSEIPLFLEIPNLHLTFEGFNTEEGIELRIGSTSITMEDLSLEKENIVDISTAFEEKTYGVHSIRIYQFNKFIKQVRFCLLPNFKSNYLNGLDWVEDKYNLKKCSSKLIINKVEGWQIGFENGIVQDLPDKYKVNIPYKEGVLNGTIISHQDNLHLSVGFELPICAYKYELFSNNEIGDRCDMADFIAGNPWLAVSFYGDYKENIYNVELVSVNGVEQKKEIKLSNNGSANFDLGVFRDTIQAVPLPVKIRVKNVETNENFDVVIIDEVVKFKYRPKYLRKSKCIAIKDEDIQQNATIEKYGEDFKFILDYSESEINDKGVRTFAVPDDIALSSGYYRIVRESNADELFATEDDFEVTLQTDQFFVALRNQKEPINSFSEWLEQFLYDFIRCRGNKCIDELQRSECYRYRDAIVQFAGSELSDNDIANITLLGNILQSKISKRHKAIATEVMLLISRVILTNKDRYRIVECLIDTKANDIVINTCKNNYCLMLLEYPTDITASHIKELAAALKPISVLFSLHMLLKGNVPICETFGSAAYKDVVGREALVAMMTTDEAEEIQNEDRKHFLREDGQSNVHIALNSDITGINNFFEMADEKKLRTGRISLDKKKIPDIGIYFAGTRYTDLFVNWYIRNHMGDIDGGSDIRGSMEMLFYSFKSKVWNKLLTANRDSSVAYFLGEYDAVLVERIPNKNDIQSAPDLEFNYPTYFYFEGIAALIAQLDEFNAFPEMKEEAVRFMVESYQIAPFITERDTLMAAVYIYLRRKERQ